MIRTKTSGMNNKKKAIVFILLFLNLVIISSAYSISYKSRAKKYFSRKQYDKANELFLKISESHPHDGETWFYLAYIAEQKKDHELAISYYKKSLEAKNVKKELYKIILWKLIIYHKQKQEFAQTYQYAKLFLSYFPRSSAVKKVINQITAIKMWTLSANAENLYFEGIKALNKGDKESATGFFQKAIIYDSQFVAPKVKLGILYMGMDYMGKAKMVFNEVIYKAPFYGIAHFYLGIILEQEGNYEEALERYKQAGKYLSSEKNFSKYQIPYRIGRCQLSLNQFDSAYKSFRTALKENRKRKKIYLLLGITQGEREKLNSASRYFKKAIRLGATTEAYYRLYKIAYLKKNKKQQVYWSKKLAGELSKTYSSEDKDMLELSKIPDRFWPPYAVSLFSNDNSRQITLPILNQFLEINFPWKHETLEFFPEINPSDIYYLIGKSYFHKNELGNALSNLARSELPEASYLAAKIFAAQKSWDQSMDNLEKTFQRDRDYIKRSMKEAVFSPILTDDRYLLLTEQITKEEVEQRKIQREIDEQERLELEKEEDEIKETGDTEKTENKTDNNKLERPNAKTDEMAE